MQMDLFTNCQQQKTKLFAVYEMKQFVLCKLICYFNLKFNFLLSYKYKLCGRIILEAQTKRIENLLFPLQFYCRG